MSRIMFLLFAVTLAPKFIVAKSLINLPQAVEQEISAFNTSSYHLQRAEPAKPLAMERQPVSAGRTSLKTFLTYERLDVRCCRP